jgi:hypothetical protein
MITNHGVFYYLKQEKLFDSCKIFINASNSIVSGGNDQAAIDASIHND